MIKKLCKHGNSLALVIDRPILELLGIDEDTPLEISSDGRSLVIARARSPEEQAEFDEAVARVRERYAETFKRLAE